MTCYRTTGTEFYGTIRKHDDGKWHAVIHYQDDGRRKQFAGIWNTLNAAKEEVDHDMAWLHFTETNQFPWKRDY